MKNNVFFEIPEVRFIDVIKTFWAWITKQKLFWPMPKETLEESIMALMRSREKLND